MPTPRKSTSALEAAGAFEQNPQRAASRSADAKPSRELGPCPDFLSDLEKQCWDQIVADCAPGALKNSDNIIVENFARLQALVRGGKGTAAIFAQIVNHTDRLAMNPKARPNVQIPKDQQSNPFANLGK